MSNEKKPEVMVLEITDKRKSGWVLDGSAENGMPQYLDSPSDYSPKTTSVRRVPLLATQDYLDKNPDAKARGVKVGDNIGYKLEKIRFIYGCDTIVVSEQDALGIKPNPAVDKNELAFKNGAKYVVRTGNMISLFDYLRNYEGNEQNPVPIPGAQIRFREIRAKQVAVKDISNFDAETDARNYLRALAIKKGDKVEYKEREVDFLCSLFNLNFMETIEEKFQALINIAVVDPVRFNTSVADVKSGMIASVNQGVKLGVIQLDATKAMLANTDKVLTVFQSEKEEEQVEELSIFFLSEEGDMLYKQFAIELRAAKERALLMES